MPARTKRVSLAARRSEGLLVERVGDEIVVYDQQSKRAHCLSPFASVVFDCCDGHGTVSGAAAIASERLGYVVSDGEVAEAVAQLEQLSLLDTPLVVLEANGGDEANGHGVSRREVMRRIGLVGAATASVTLITSVVAPTAAFASGVPTGCTGCTKNSDCASNHCCQNNAGKQCAQTCCVGKDNSCHFVTSGSTLLCTVCLSTTGCATCPCSTCPGGSTVCCTQNC